ncbi:MAG: hypothetical protein K5769_00910 [Pseudobutyrivibrio sp.]|nr:hypothetical protein [Pseudobutyrivibrio sp.]
MQYDSEKNLITNENAYAILKAFAKEYKKQNGEAPAEIIIVGGGSIMLNYGFRKSTQDFDIMLSGGGSDIKDIIHRVAEKYNLPDDWMNTDFKRTISYSNKLRQVSSHMFSFNHNSLEIRTIKDEYLIAMKMISARQYRNDLSDVVGILSCSLQNGKPISFEMIETAINELYSSTKKVKTELMERVKQYSLMIIEELNEIYSDLKEDENRTLEDLQDINHKYKDVVTEQSVDDVIAALKRKAKEK